MCDNNQIEWLFKDGEICRNRVLHYLDELKNKHSEYAIAVGEDDILNLVAIIEAVFRDNVKVQ